MQQSKNEALNNPDFDDVNNEQSDQDLYEHYNIVVDKGQSLLRVDKFLTSRIENASRNRIQAAATAGNILVNGKPIKSNYRVKPQDIVSVVMPHPPRNVDIIPENIPLDILYEDDDLLVVNKQAGMVVHPGHGNYSGTLVNALAYHLRGTGAVDTSDERGGLLVHRIDKNTSGVMVVAKNDVAHSKLASQFFHHTTLRKYIALVWGVFKEPEGTIVGNIGRSPYDKLKMTVFSDPDLGKHAVTHYKVMEELGYVSIVECRLETGRTHQIRVHMEHMGHPLFNDERYGGNRVLRGTTFTKYKQFVENCFALLPRQALHAAMLGFIHPTTGEQMEFETPLPSDMEQAIAKWKGYVNNRPLIDVDE